MYNVALRAVSRSYRLDRGSSRCVWSSLISFSLAARGRVPSFVSVTVERTLRARTRVKRRPHVRRACTRDMHNRGCTAAILEIAVCFPPGGDRTRDLRSYTPAVSRYIFSAGALKNARPSDSPPSSPRHWPDLPGLVRIHRVARFVAVRKVNRWFRLTLFISGRAMIYAGLVPELSRLISP